MTAEPRSELPTHAPLVSLVMPAWNPNRAWLRQAVAAALGQEGCDIELVVVDDGSDTPIEHLLDGLEDERLRLRRIPHGRVSRARNAGVDVARGDYFRFIDSDDVILPGSTSRLLAVADSADDVIAYGATLTCDEELQPLSLTESTLQGSVVESCLLNRFETTIHSLLFPRRIVERIGPWEPSIVVSQDWDYSLRAFEHAPVRGDRRVATHYRTHGGMNSRNVEEGIRGYRLVVERYFERHPEQRGQRIHRRALALYHVFAAVQLATVLRHHGAAFGHLRRALALDPVLALTALPRQGAMPLMPSPGRIRRLLPRWLRPT